MVEYCKEKRQLSKIMFGCGEFHMSVEAEESLIESLASSKTSALLVGRNEDETVCVGSIQASPRERIAHQSELL